MKWLICDCVSSCSLLIFTSKTDTHTMLLFIELEEPGAHHLITNSSKAVLLLWLIWFHVLVSIFVSCLHLLCAYLLMLLSSHLLRKNCSLSLPDVFFEDVITKTCPCNVYPLEPHFFIVKLGFAGVYLNFLSLIQNIHCGYSLEPPRRGGSNVYPQCMF